MMVQVMTHSGMRISELINLKVQDVDFSTDWSQGRTLLKKRKRKGESYAKIDEVFLPDLQRYKDKKGLSESNYWFTTNTKDANGKDVPYTQG